MEGKTLLYIYFAMIILAIIIVPTVVSHRTNSRKQKQDIIIERPVVHLGGHPYLESNQGILYLQIRKDNKIHLYKDSTKDELRKDYEIDLDKVTKYEIKNNEQLQKDITMGRFLVFGLASLALQKKSKVVNEYLILSYMENNIEINCLFKGVVIGAERLGDIISVLNRIRIEVNRG